MNPCEARDNADRKTSLGARHSPNACYSHRLVHDIDFRENGVPIWVDADACPAAIKQILFRAAKRTGMALTLVANQPLTVPRVAHIRAVQVARGFDVADDEIVRRVARYDLVITADIPLAAEVLAKGAQALSPRGEMYSPDDIVAKHTLRDFMDTLRASGIHGAGPPPLGEKERQAFANALDRWLARAPR